MYLLFFLFIIVESCKRNFIFDPMNLTSLKEMAVISDAAYDEPQYPNCSYGWKNSSIRSDVYVNDKNELLIAFKGTDLFGYSSSSDKYNNNLLFSCCCAKINFSWRPVCDCYQKGECHQKCLQKEWWSNERSYLWQGNKIVSQIREQYPQYDKIYFTGHSLGGALAAWMSWSLTQIGYESGAIVFATPGTASLIYRSTRIIHNVTNIFSLGSMYDPVFIGQCGSFGTACYHAGYAIETSRLMGYKAYIDNLNNKISIKKSILQHRMKWIIKNLNKVPDYRLDNSVDKCSEFFN